MTSDQEIASIVRRIIEGDRPVKGILQEILTRAQVLYAA